MLWAKTLSTIVVDSKKMEEKTSLDQVLSSEDIEDMVTGNGDVPSLLKTNPNVKVIENKSDPSSIEPAKIEINNAKYYQNNFLLDGLSVDSLLDPNSYNSIDDVKGNESEIFLDLDLIESIKVLDSAISAKYGSFSGGVIDVKLKNPSASHKFKIKYRHTSDKLTNIHAPKDASSASRPKFEKHSLNATYSGGINESNGVIASYSTKYGKRPTRYMEGYKDVKNSSSNVLLKFLHYLKDDGIAGLAIVYSPYENKAITGRYVKDGDYTSKGGGVSLKFNFDKDINLWGLNYNLSIKQSQNSRSTDNSYLKHWRKTNTKDWGRTSVVGKSVSTEGSWGDIEKTQKSILTNLRLQKKSNGNVFLTGLEANFIRGNYKRNEELFVYSEPQTISSIRCNGYTQDCIQREQFFQRRDIYQKEDVSADMFMFASYIEDLYQTNYADLSLGLRLDYNDYLKNIDLAPRTRLELHFFDKKTRIFFGANRYYAKSFLSNKLREARTPYKSEYRSKLSNELNSSMVPPDKINPTVWNMSADKGSDKYVFSSLKTPYTDEGMIGLSQTFANNTIRLKFVDRKAKKQFTSHKGKMKKFTRPDGVKAYYYPRFMTNNGETTTKIYTLSIDNANPIEILHSSFGYSFSVGKMESNTNFISYDSDDEQELLYVVYKGKVRDKQDVQNYQQPSTYSLVLKHKVKNIDLFSIGWLLNSTLFISYVPPYTKPSSSGKTQEEVIDGETQILPVFEDERINDAKNLDLRISLNATISKDQRVRITADILNLLDDVSDNSSSYELGRQFWLGVEYSF